MTLTTCLECGTPSDGPHCPEHTTTTPKVSPRLLGYDTTWDKLSVRARKLQPWCTDCGTTFDLTCDHSPEAWARKAAGKPIRLLDVDVVCRPCNAKRGQARGVSLDSGGVDPRRGRTGTAPLAKFRSERPPRPDRRPS